MVAVQPWARAWVKPATGADLGGSSKIFKREL